MYLRREIVNIGRLICDLQAAIADTAEKNLGAIMPGYTHLQRAQPVLFSHHLLAYLFMLARDFSRLQGVWERTDIMPLGAGALAGATFPINRHLVAEQLKFDALYDNSVDAVSDRDFVMEFLAFAAILMVHLSRLSEEIVLWASSEFKFIELDDAHCTGSSIMPQKKNPDVAELVRGKTGRVVGHLVAMLTVMKGLPLAYNKDMQEDKEGLFDAVDTVKFSLAVYAAMLRGLKVREENMLAAVREDFANATDMADYLVKKGLPFRQAHEIVGRSVRYCLDKGCRLTDLSLAELAQFSPLFAADILDAIREEACVAARSSYGGTAPARVEEALVRGRALVERQLSVLDTYRTKGI